MATKELKVIIGLLAGISGTTFLAFVFPIPGLGIWFSYGVMTMLFMITAMYLLLQMRGQFWDIGLSKNAMLMDRRDGFREFVKADYITGWLKSKYGYHLNTEQKPELKTKKNLSIAIDMYGPTVTPEHVLAVEEFAKKYHIQSPSELEETLEKWRKCEHCGWEGIPEEKTSEKTIEVGGIKEKQVIREGYVCGNIKCGKADKMIECTPKVLTPFYKTVSLEPVKLLMKYAMNPSKCVTLVDRLARIKMGFGEKIAAFIGRMLGYGVFLLLLFIGLYIFFGVGGG